MKITSKYNAKIVVWNRDKKNETLEVEITFQTYNSEFIRQKNTKEVSKKMSSFIDQSNRSECYFV
jgi:hypothetical protein